MAIFAVAALFTSILFSCDHSDTVSHFLDNVRPSAHFRVVDFHISGDTVKYYQVRYPKPLR